MGGVLDGRGVGVGITPGWVVGEGTTCSATRSLTGAAWATRCGVAVGDGNGVGKTIVGEAVAVATATTATDDGSAVGTGC